MSANLSELAASAQVLQQRCKTLLLSSCNHQGDPEISYAPYFRDTEGVFYIFISELAAHTRNLQAHPKASIMFIADEQDSQNLFARERLIYSCDVGWVAPEQAAYEILLDQLQVSLGNTVGMLRSLADFRLCRLVPTAGRYVVGFGKAYELSVTGELTHITEERIKERGGD